MALPPSKFFRIGPRITVTLRRRILNCVRRIINSGNAVLSLCYKIKLFTLTSTGFKFGAVINVRDKQGTVATTHHGTVDLNVGTGFRYRATTGTTQDKFFKISLESSIVIISPPHRKYRPRIVRTVTSSRTEYLVCISYSPSALAESLRELAGSNFAVGGTHLFSVFPHSCRFRDTLLLMQ